MGNEKEATEDTDCQIEESKISRAVDEAIKKTNRKILDDSLGKEDEFLSKIVKFTFEQNKREYDREIDEQLRRRAAFETGQIGHEELLIDEPGEDNEDDESDIQEEINPEEEKLIVKGKKIKRREKEKREKTPKRVQWRRS